ncbi:MAG TPA: hypothetical protein VNJ02_06315 [Vicinamibacterales bacterium]|nr:hypothetical protein [Vicinamibacterales bacterium]
MAAVGIVTAVAWPLWQHTHKRTAEATAADFIQRLSESQDRFQQAYQAFAAELTSLTEPCEGWDHWLDRDLVATVRKHGYEIVLRPTTDAQSRAVDCRGRATTSDYYAALTPGAGGGLAQRAYARRATGDAFVFFDGVAPQERDFPPGGLATPLRDRDSLVIP